jgi:hypothetical protein
MADLETTLAAIGRKWRRAEEVRRRPSLACLSNGEIEFLCGLIVRHGDFWKKLDELSRGEVEELQRIVTAQVVRWEMKN